MMAVLTVITVLLSVILPIASALEWIPSLGYLLVICPVFMLLILQMYRRGYLRSGVRLEFLVETIFVSAGVIAVLRQMSM